jgi:uncharacterized membrane protein
VRPNLALAAAITGYIQLIDFHALVSAVAEADAVVRFLFRPGRFVVKGTTLAVAEGLVLRRSRSAEMFGHTVGVRRTLVQDTEFDLA